MQQSVALSYLGAPANGLHPPCIIIYPSGLKDFCSECV